MRTKIGCLLVICLIAMLFISAAFADSICSFTFTSASGITYQGYHHIEGNHSWFEVPNRVQDRSPSFDWITQEYAIYQAAESAAIEKHAAVCPYMHNLGDARVPMPLLYGGAVLALAAIILVYSLRKKHRRLPAVKSSYAQSR